MTNPLLIQLGEGRIIIGARINGDAFELSFSDSGTQLEIGSTVAPELEGDKLCVVRFKSEKDLDVLEKMIGEIRTRMREPRRMVFRWVYHLTEKAIEELGE